MDKNEIIKYITKTPENSNPNILRSMLDEEGSGEGGSFLVHITLEDWNEDTGTYDTVIVDKTIDEIWDAANEGKYVVGKVNDDQMLAYDVSNVYFYQSFDDYTDDWISYGKETIFWDGNEWIYNYFSQDYDLYDYFYKGDILTVYNDNLVFYEPEVQPSNWRQVAIDDIEYILSQCTNVYLMVQNSPAFWSVTEGISVYPLLYFHNIRGGSARVAQVAFGKITIAPNEISYEFIFNATQDDYLELQRPISEFIIQADN